MTERERVLLARALNGGGEQQVAVAMESARCSCALVSTSLDSGVVLVVPLNLP